VTYPTNDGIYNRLTDLYTSSGAAVSDLSGVVAGADVLSSQFADVKNALQDLQDLADALRNGYAYTPVGVVVPFAGAEAKKPPFGWLVCNGDIVPNGSGTVQGLTADFSALYNVLGSSHGSAGQLPDLRGRVVAGVDNMGGLDAGRLDWANTLGTAGGTQNHILTPGETALRTHAHSGTTGGENETHVHTFSMQSRNAYTLGAAGAGFYPGGSFSTVGPDRVHTHNFSTSGITEANGSAHNNMQPTILLNYLIKV
jgi:microcystin-dependent protein